MILDILIDRKAYLRVLKKMKNSRNALTTMLVI